MTSFIDPSMLGQYRDVMGAEGDEFIKDLVQTFLIDAEKLTNQMYQALEDGDQEIFQRSAHTLKTSVATMGAKEPAKRFKEMELKSEMNDFAGLSDELDIASKELRSVYDELKELFLDN